MIEPFPNTNVPWGIREIIHAALNNPQTQPDHLLLLADWIDAMVLTLPPGNHFAPNTAKCAAVLRDRAPLLPPVID